MTLNPPEVRAAKALLSAHRRSQRESRTPKIDAPKLITTPGEATPRKPSIKAKIEAFVAGAGRCALCLGRFAVADMDLDHRVRWLSVATRPRRITRCFAGHATAPKHRKTLRGSPRPSASHSLSVLKSRQPILSDQEGFNDGANTMSDWQPIATLTDTSKPILGWCVHNADPYVANEATGSLTLYGGHAEGLSHVEDGPHVLEWGGSWSDSWEDGGGYMPDWWFLRGSEFEVAAFPTHWMPIPAAPADTEPGQTP